MPLIQTITGPQQNNQDGAQPPARAGRQGDLIISDLHGRFYEQTVRGNVYTYGTSNFALSSTSAIVTGLTASATPIVAVWNPQTSPVNLVILQAIINTTTIQNSAVSPGGFMWLYSTMNSAITTGTAPINCKNLNAVGSYAKAFSGAATALTGMTNSLAVLRSTALNSINGPGPATAISQPVQNGLELVDGSIIVPPGGVIAIMNQVSTTTVSVSAGLVWEEVPV